MHMNLHIKRELTPWKGEIERHVWSEHARSASVLVHAAGDGAHMHMLLVDDHGGIRGAFKVTHGHLPEAIAAATRSWLERNVAGSFSVFTEMSTLLKARGGISPPPPPPPPGPGGDEFERVLIRQTVAAHAAFGAAVELGSLARFGDGQHLDAGLER